MKKIIWPFLGFISIGLTIGYIAGLSSGSIVDTIVTSIFAFIGGSSIWLVNKYDFEQRKVLGLVLFGLSFGMLIGINVGIFMKTHEVFIPQDFNRENEPIEILRANEIEIDSLKSQLKLYDDGLLKEEELINWIMKNEK